MTAQTPWNEPEAFKAGFPLSTAELRSEIFNNIKHLYEVPAVSMVATGATAIPHDALPFANRTAVTGFAYSWGSHGNFSSAGTGQPYHVTGNAIHLTRKGIWHLELSAEWEARTIFERVLSVLITPYSWISDVIVGRAAATDVCYQSCYSTMLTSSDDPVKLAVDAGQSSGITLDISNVRLTAVYGGNV